MPTTATTTYSRKRKPCVCAKARNSRVAEKPPATATSSSISTKRGARPLVMKRESQLPTPMANR
ncbi:MAG: hypothetical protein BWY76_03503 [bacterium ADurb.Bin429]|nr:MAG: hypothetical protein BWY76_03503 [bacterium ADurb.Bin429]